MSNVRSYTTDQLLDRVEELKSFKTIPVGYWILGVRSNEDAPNKYDDKFYLFNGEQFVKVVTGTTNPGTPILQGGFLKYNKEKIIVEVSACPDGNPIHLILLYTS